MGNHQVITHNQQKENVEKPIHVCFDINEDVLKLPEENFELSKESNSKGFKIDALDIPRNLIVPDSNSSVKSFLTPRYKKATKPISKRKKCKSFDLSRTFRGKQRNLFSSPSNVIPIKGSLMDYIENGSYQSVEPGSIVEEVVEMSEFNEIKEFTNFEHYNILYNSDLDGLTSRDLNSKVCGHSNVMFIIKGTNEELFGCYQEETMTLSTHKNIKTYSEKPFYLFSKTNGIYQQYHRSQQSNLETILIHSNTDKAFVFTAFSAFWVLSDGMVYQHQLLKENYEVPYCTTSPLHNKVSTKPIKLKNLIVIELY
ncbi:TLDc domain-containing protein [Entamoeba marina]